MGFQKTKHGKETESVILQNNRESNIVTKIHELIPAQTIRDVKPLHRVMSHLAIRTNNVEYIENAEIPVLNKFTINKKDLIQSIKETNLVLKTGAYPKVDSKAVTFGAFNHTLDCEYIPVYTDMIQYILKNKDDELCMITVTDDCEMIDGEITGFDCKVMDENKLLSEIGKVNAVYPQTNTDSIPKKFTSI